MFGITKLQTSRLNSSFRQERASASSRYAEQMKYLSHDLKARAIYHRELRHATIMSPIYATAELSPNERRRIHDYEHIHASVRANYNKVDDFVLEWFFALMEWNQDCMAFEGKPGFLETCTEYLPSNGHRIIDVIPFVGSIVVTKRLSNVSTAWDRAKAGRAVSDDLKLIRDHLATELQRERDREWHGVFASFTMENLPVIVSFMLLVISFRHLIAFRKRESA